VCVCQRHTKYVLVRAGAAKYLLECVSTIISPPFESPPFFVSSSPPSIFVSSLLRPYLSFYRFSLSPKHVQADDNDSDDDNDDDLPAGVYAFSLLHTHTYTHTH